MISVAQARNALELLEQAVWRTEGQEPFDIVEKFVAQAVADIERLDSGCIMMNERDDFGESIKCEHRGVNLRAAIDEAMAYAARSALAQSPADEKDHRNSPPDLSDLISQKAVSTLQADHTALLKMLARRARHFPSFPIGNHIPEVFAAIGEELPPILERAPLQAEQPAMGYRLQMQSDSHIPGTGLPPRPDFKVTIGSHPPAAVEAAQKPVAWVDERVISWLAQRPGHDAGARITTILGAAKSFERPMPVYASPGATALRPLGKHPNGDDLKAALQFYADGGHFTKHEPGAWDTVSDEPSNFYEDASSTATVEDGTIAAKVLRGELTSADLAREDGPNV